MDELREGIIFLHSYVCRLCRHIPKCFVEDKSLVGEFDMFSRHSELINEFWVTIQVV